jgi:ribosomal protein L18E
MADLFSPRRSDGRAEWRVIYDAVVDLAYGTDVSYKQIAAWLDSDDRARAHRAVRRCNRQFTQESKARVLGNVRGVGYRVFQPADYAPAAMSIQRQARRRITSAVDLMRTAPLQDMTPAQRDWAHKVTMVLVDNELRLRSQEQWQKDAERRLSELEQRAGIQPPLVEGTSRQAS